MTKRIWVAASSGLFWYEYDATSIVDQTEEPVLPYKISDIKYDANQDLLWVSTGVKGLFVLKDKTVIHNFTTKEGLSSNICTEMYIDAASNVWVGTVMGLNHIAFNEDFSITNFSELSGLGKIKINDIEKIENKIYLATENGITVLPTEMGNIRNQPPLIYMDKMEVNDHSVLLSDELSLSHSQNSIKFYFTGLSYRDQGNIRYQYRLKGQDEEWTTTFSNNIHYRALLPGSYQFELKAINGSGVESIQSPCVSFLIDRPFWKKEWFVLVVCGFVFLLLYLFWKDRMNRLRGKYQLEQKLIEAENEKLELENNFLDLELRALRQQMNPHFLFNALNTIKGFYAQAKIREGSGYITKFARLLRLILENSDKHIPLEKEIQTLRLYTDLSKLRYLGKFDYEINTWKDLNVADVAIPSMLLQPFVENAIIHGLTPMEKDGLLSIHFKAEQNMLVSRIKDNGIGRAAASKIRKPGSHQSKAIEITTARLQIIHKREQLEDYFKIEDLKDENGNAAGTLVTIKTPLKKIW